MVGAYALSAYVAKVPMVRPSGALSGTDQQARRPSDRARSRKAAQRGSVSMSAVMHGSPVWPAVPHVPTSGPISTPSIASR